VVDVVDEVVERADALGEPALDRAPLRDGQDVRHEVERDGRSEASPPSAPATSNVMSWRMKIASRRRPASARPSAAACGRGAPSAP
jgi:hypothetical protein